MRLAGESKMGRKRGKPSSAGIREKASYNMREAGQLIGVSQPTLRLIIKRGELPVITGGRDKRVSQAAIDRYLGRGTG
jgi:excisionase family DNA binding protein